MSKERIYELLDEINAIHEAGHAVVTILVGVSLGCVELVHPSQDVGDEFGRCYRGITTDSETEVLIKFAGVGAELIHRNKGEKWSSPFASSGRGDWQAAKPYLDANGDNRRAAVKSAKSKVTQLLRDNWSWVLAVSSLLREKRFLFGSEVAALAAVAGIENVA